jgi:UDP-N-acetylglucosamine--N-acetylmuramyl-(pentapeptide) pyrophosphoryl-undecaprenol N-acetylglucosamine transferase
LAIADALRVLRPDVRVVFVGAERGLEARVLPERGEEHLLLPVQGIDRRALLGNWRAFTGLAVGLVRVLRLFSRIRPEVVVVTGGYAGAAAGIAAGLMGVPLVLQEQNSVPGAVTMLLTRFAARVHVAFPEAVGRLPAASARCVVSGNPVRSRSPKTRAQARAAFGIPEDATLALVTGGSQGSLGLNRGVTAYVEGVCRGDIERVPELHLLWATGRQHLEGVAEALQAAGAPGWVHALPYIEDVPGALVAADFALCRAGAITMAELLNQGVPAILVPLPTAAANHQMHNARALEAAGAATVLPEDELTDDRLARALSELAVRRDLRADMSARALERARPHATVTIAADVAKLLRPRRSAA